MPSICMYTRVPGIRDIATFPTCLRRVHNGSRIEGAHPNAWAKCTTHMFQKAFWRRDYKTRAGKGGKARGNRKSIQTN